jgi:hypothetical protein
LRVHFENIRHKAITPDTGQFKFVIFISFNKSFIHSFISLVHHSCTRKHSNPFSHTITISEDFRRMSKVYFKMSTNSNSNIFRYKFTEVSEERIASIITVVIYAQQSTRNKLQTEPFSSLQNMLLPSSGLKTNLKFEVAISFETSISVYKTTKYHKPEGYIIKQ